MKWDETEKVDNAAVCDAMFRLQWDELWPSFFFFFGETKFTHAQYIMCTLDSTRQKSDVLGQVQTPDFT